jgi:DNA-binding MarR family transcriptional regulator
VERAPSPLIALWLGHESTEATHRDLKPGALRGVDERARRLTSHFQVLRWPSPSGQRPVELAEQAGMTRQAMNYLLGQLEELGYLERRVDPDDPRSRRVYLTRRGTSTITVIRDAVAELERDWETRMGTADWQQLKQLLLQLNEVVGDEAANA